MMSFDLYEIIKSEAKKYYPNEACGVIVRIGKKQLPITCKNVSETPREHFVLSPVDYAKACGLGEVVGIWHTHPEHPARPSEADLAGCESSGLPWYLVAIYKQGDEIAFSDLISFEPSGFEKGYLGRPYAFGVFDCWSLARDYYRREFGIVLGDQGREEGFWSRGEDLLGGGWKREGFVRLVDDEEPKVGDLFLIQTNKFGIPDHVAIYIGNETILHHCRNRLSGRDLYGGYWKKHTTHHLRHEKLC